MLPSLITPYEPALDLDLMVKTGKCSRCDANIQLLNVELDAINRRQVYWYRCGQCEECFMSDKFIASNIKH